MIYTMRRLELIILYFYAFYYSTIPLKSYIMLLSFNIMLTITFILPTVSFTESFRTTISSGFNYLPVQSCIWGKVGALATSLHY